MSAPVLAYAWTRNASALTGASAAAYTTPATTAAMNGDVYAVTVTAQGTPAAGAGRLVATDVIKITYPALLSVNGTSPPPSPPLPVISGATPVPTLGQWTLLLLALLLGGMAARAMRR
jgi:hypothetical protein